MSNSEGEDDVEWHHCKECDAKFLTELGLRGHKGAHETYDRDYGNV